MRNLTNSFFLFIKKKKYLKINFKTRFCNNKLFLIILAKDVRSAWGALLDEFDVQLKIMKQTGVRSEWQFMDRIPQFLPMAEYWEYSDAMDAVRENEAARQ